ncbi:MAG: hypothetical protein QF893_23005 [Alphaproteobacteria bacterium]|nr:hypothetical protein [Alphaproteobacteria bacterium]
MRSANRNRNETDNRNNNIGFRVASTPSRRSRRVQGRDGRAKGVSRVGHCENEPSTAGWLPRPARLDPNGWRARAWLHSPERQIYLCIRHTPCE